MSSISPFIIVSLNADALNEGVPGTPEGLTAAPNDGSVTLSWSAPTSPGNSDVLQYNLTRRDGSGGGDAVVFQGNALTYTDNGLTNGVTYYYKVCAVNTQGQGEWSAEVSATPKATVVTPSAPTFNSATAGDAKVTLSWSAPNSNGGGTISDYKIYRGTATNGETFLVDAGTGLSYTDTGVSNGQTYYYQISAVNEAGEGDRSNELSATPKAPASVPGAPTLSSASAGNAQVSLSWTAPSDGGSAITSYKLYRGTTANGESLLKDVGNVLTYTDTGLNNGQVYYYKVSAVNNVGEGSGSNELSATPVAPKTAPAAPTLTSATAGDTQVSLSWSAPSDGGSTITGYKVYRGTASGGETLLTTLGSVLSYVDRSVSNGGTYYYVVSAVNSVGEGAKSNERSASPVAPDTVPAAPSLTAATAGDAKVTLSWTAPSSDGGSAVTGYKIYRGTTSGSETLLTTVGNVLTYVDSTAVNGQTYYYKVSAVNAVGESSGSNERSATPAAPKTAPSAPSLSSSTAGNAQVKISWSAPTSDGGSAITSYKIYRGTAENGETLLKDVGNVLTYTDTALANGQVYYYKVSAVNSIGESARSNEMSATPLSVPGAPTLTKATAGNGLVSLAWSAPSSNGGSAVTIYAVYRGTAAGQETYLEGVGSNLTYEDRTVTNGVTYYYKVTAVNGVGESARSNEMSALPQAPVTAPGPPGDIQAKASDGRVVLSWTAPTDNGGSAVTGYRVYRGTSATTIMPLATVSGTSFSDTITNGRTYYYQVTALNPAEGDKSAVVTAIFTTVTTAPRNLTATGGNGFIALTWIAPSSDGGSAVLHYNVYRGTDSGSLTLHSSTNDISLTDLEVAGGVEYTYAVAAVNKVGESARSSTVTASALTVTSAPSVPQDVAAVVNDGNVMLNWTAPASDGGSAVTGYSVYRGVSSTVLIPMANTTDLWYMDTTAVKGMTYYYAITAVNAIGESARSSELTVTVVLASIPSEPLNLIAKAVNDTIVLSWDVPSQSGGSAITSYIVYRGTDPEEMSYITSVSNITYRDSDRQGGVTYYYSVVAVNSAGEGPAAATVSMTLPRSSEVSSAAGLVAIGGIAAMGVMGVMFLLRRSRQSGGKMV